MKLNITNITKVVKHIKQYIAKGDYMDLTIGYDPKTKDWDYQTGDNSYSGAAYHYPIWGVTSVYPKSKSKDLAQSILNQIKDQIFA